MIGRARDILTGPDGGAPVELASGDFILETSPKRELVTVEIEPRHRSSQALVGLRAGGASRALLAETMADIRGTPLYQLLDDFPGASLVAGWIWAHWDPDWVERIARHAVALPAGFKGPASNICAGYAEGSSGLDEANRPISAAHHRVDVCDPADPADPAGWHAMPALEGPVAARTRRMDVWRDGSSLRVDAGFQDSGQAPDGGRVALHEYRVHAVVDCEMMVLSALQALPLVLPFPECPAASINASRLIGQPVGDFRELVVRLLPRTSGCTHLNDVLRAFADVPQLAEHLPR